MSKCKFHGAIIECAQGDIADQPDMEAIVNAANALLKSGGGVAGAIHRAAGPALEQECRKLAPLLPGQAVISSAYHLPNRYVIHCLGPIYRVDEPSEQLLALCYRNALQLGEDNGIQSIAFPAISTGVFGYPPTAAAKIACMTVLNVLPHLATVHHVRFVLFSLDDLRIYEQILDESIKNKTESTDF